MFAGENLDLTDLDEEKLQKALKKQKEHAKKKVGGAILIITVPGRVGKGGDMSSADLNMLLALQADVDDRKRKYNSFNSEEVTKEDMEVRVARFNPAVCHVLVSEGSVVGSWPIAPRDGPSLCPPLLLTGVAAYPVSSGLPYDEAPRRRPHGQDDGLGHAARRVTRLAVLYRKG